MMSAFMAEAGQARPRAEHCDELVRRGPRPEERAELVSLWRREFGRTLAREFGALLPGDRLDVTVSEPETMRGADVIARIGPVAANSLLRCGDADRTALLSFDHATAIALTDRSFGGDGDVAQAQESLGSGAPGGPLPRSAAMLVDRAAGIVARALAGSSVQDGVDTATSSPSGGGECAAEVMVRSESASRLKPFAADAPCIALSLAIANRDGREWEARLALTKRVFDALLPDSEVARSSPGQDPPPASGSHSSFASIPIPIEGVLAEFDLSLGRLERLAPGDTIALCVPGELPLRIGGCALGWGRLGTVGDRMAIRLTRLPAERAPIGEGAQA
jgi:flagellar motor switch/type III secretory pathway protein FliN